MQAAAVVDTCMGRPVESRLMGDRRVYNISADDIAYLFNLYK